MPSVRVKRHQYSHLSEPHTAGANSEPPRSLSTIFRQPSAQELHQIHSPHTAPLHPHGLQTRDRSSSIVHALVTRGSARAPLIQRRPRPDSESSNHTHSGVVTLEGSVTDIQVAGDAATGIIGSALDVAAQEDGCHHHDDIVEHLDVIDPQVGTVGTLTNAANAILMFVHLSLSLLSSCPLVLPTHSKV
jgi:hypothetical protein